jgi:hypothetical protein
VSEALGVPMQGVLLKHGNPTWPSQPRQVMFRTSEKIQKNLQLFELNGFIGRISKFKSL